MSRLFVAIPLSAEMKKAIIQTLHEMKKGGIKGSFVPIDNFHVTLAFIGETRQSKEISDELSQIHIKPFKLTMDELGCFGDLLKVSIKGNQGLTGLARSVRAALDAAGVSYDTKKFTPHITIIRRMSGNWKEFAAPKGEMMVKSFSLMKSEMKDGKRVYTEIGRFG